MYFGLFEVADRNKGKLMRRVINGKKGNLIGTVTNIGKNTLALIPRKVAQMIGLPNWEAFSGHSSRGTTLTLLAESGMSLSAMRNVSGIFIYDEKCVRNIHICLQFSIYNHKNYMNSVIHSINLFKCCRLLFIRC